jgi:hypothetical protein
MCVPSQCTIVKVMGRSAYSSRLNTQKETTELCVCKESSVHKSVYRP